jgi:hypothetical protein
VQEIPTWLGRLGLGQYAQRFADHEIDVSVLPHLTDQDLKDIGIPLGHRRKILVAISELTAAEQAAPAPSAAVILPKPANVAERRQVTVMFADLVGSTELSARMDPEDLRDIISTYQKCVTGTVRRFGGFVAKYMGDGVLIYFGYPEAHEDDPDRAVRAALELIVAVSALKARVLLQIRIGIATGVVMPRNAGLWARLRTSLRGCKWSRHPTPWSLPTVLGNFSEISSSCRTSGQRISRASRARCARGRSCDPAP